jgi:hypothetical protein
MLGSPTNLIASSSKYTGAGTLKMLETIEPALVSELVSMYANNIYSKPRCILCNVGCPEETDSGLHVKLCIEIELELTDP